MSKIFLKTSDIPYDRHHYRIWLQNKSFVVNHGMRFKNIGGIIVIQSWFEGTVVHDIIDKPKPF